MKHNLRRIAWKKHIVTFLSLTIVLTLTACHKEESASSDASQAGVEEVSSGDSQASENVATNTEWAVYWYLCGSDLESNFAAATNDLAEMIDVKLPENHHYSDSRDRLSGNRAWRRYLYHDVCYARQPG